jgi:hypothetical protein
MWLTCLRGHSTDVDLSVDNYHAHDMEMLLNIKQRIDNTFEYGRGLRRVTKEVFHSTLKSQLKMKRYQMKKTILMGKPKLSHIPLEHWMSMEKLIKQERKMLEAEKLKNSRAQVKNLSSIGLSEGEVRANMVRTLHPPVGVLCHRVQGFHA